LVFSSAGRTIIVQVLNSGEDGDTNNAILLVLNIF